jgi:hypothetical protein
MEKDKRQKDKDKSGFTDIQTFVFFLLSFIFIINFSNIGQNYLWQSETIFLFLRKQIQKSREEIFSGHTVHFLVDLFCGVFVYFRSAWIFD